MIEGAPTGISAEKAPVAQIRVKPLESFNESLDVLDGNSKTPRKRTSMVLIRFSKGALPLSRQGSTILGEFVAAARKGLYTAGYDKPLATAGPSVASPNGEKSHHFRDFSPLDRGDG